MNNKTEIESLTSEEKEVLRNALKALPRHMLLSGEEYSKEYLENILNTLKSVTNKLDLKY